MPRLFHHNFAIAVLLALAFTGCGPSASAPSAVPTPPPAPTAGPNTWFPIRIGGQTIRAQLAIRPDELKHGLVNRRELGPDDGMIYLYLTPQRLGFWMENTPLRLDVGYFDTQGILREVYPLYPYNTNVVYSSRHDLQFALEMNQGWFDKHHLGAGAALDIGTLRDALRARGFNMSATPEPGSPPTP